MITASQLSHAFHGQPVLNGVDITLQAGDITVCIGPSGAGKTTLLRMLAAADTPDSGHMQWGDQHYTFPLAAGAAKPKPWPAVTVVFQQLFLWPHLTLRENILLPARNIQNPNMDQELAELIEWLDMADFIDRYPNQASLGQRQRVALARAIMLHPQFILMDEITSALDVEQIRNILSLLPRLKERGIGIFLITHLINFARRAADHVIFMDNGTIVERGSAAILDTPQHPRLQEFLAVVRDAS